MPRLDLSLETVEFFAERGDKGNEYFVELQSKCRKYLDRRKKRPTAPPDPSRFEGDDYVESRDYARLRGQILDIFELMRDGKWRTVAEIQAALVFAKDKEYPENSIQAQLRNLRKPENGGYDVQRRGRGGTVLSEYRMDLDA